MNVIYDGKVKKRSSHIVTSGNFILFLEFCIFLFNLNGKHPNTANKSFIDIDDSVHESFPRASD